MEVFSLQTRSGFRRLNPVGLATDFWAFQWWRWRHLQQRWWSTSGNRFTTPNIRGLSIPFHEQMDGWVWPVYFFVHCCIMVFWLYFGVLVVICFILNTSCLCFLKKKKKLNTLKVTPKMRKWLPLSILTIYVLELKLHRSEWLIEKQE